MQTPKYWFQPSADASCHPVKLGRNYATKEEVCPYRSILYIMYIIIGEKLTLQICPLMDPWAQTNPNIKYVCLLSDTFFDPLQTHLDLQQTTFGCVDSANDGWERPENDQQRDIQ